MVRLKPFKINQKKLNLSSLFQICVVDLK